MLTRAVLVIVCAGAAAMVTVCLSASPARADDTIGDVTCDDANPSPACQVTAGRSHDSDGNPGSTGNTDGGSSANQSDTRCVYDQADPSAATVAALGGQPSGDGAWYLKTCFNNNGVAATSAIPVWVAGGQAPAVSPDALALVARTRLDLPAVRVLVSPAGDQLVGLPTWLALEPGSWGARSSTASVPGVSVTATARPTSVTWSTGEGGRVVCTGPGTRWTPGMDPKRASPDCGYTYRHSSASAPGTAFRLTVTVAWQVTWAGAGRTGTIPDLTTTASLQMRVQESQAVATG
jgi:hypothetical protein